MGPVLMNIEVKTLPFPFHSQVDPNPIKYEVFCNFNHCIHFNARLTSLYAFMRCICHRDIVPCTFTIRLLFWGSPLGFCSPLVAAEQTLQAEARGRSDACPLLNSRCQVPTTRSLMHVITMKGGKEKPLCCTLKKGFRLLSRDRELQSLRGCLSLAPASLAFELTRQSVLFKSRCKNEAGRERSFLR